MTDDSFTYNSVDLYKLARLKIIHYDVFMAPLRARKVLVPMRSGMYDYGAKYHDERQLRMECSIDGEITDAQFDELKYVLSRKGPRLILWDKQDRYYVGQC
jgi:phage-related protein